MSTHWKDYDVADGFRTACGKHSQLSFHTATKTSEVTCKACWNTVSFRRALSRVRLTEDPRWQAHRRADT